MKWNVSITKCSIQMISYLRNFIKCRNTLILLVDASLRSRLHWNGWWCREEENRNKNTHKSQVQSKHVWPLFTGTIPHNAGNIQMHFRFSLYFFFFFSFDLHIFHNRILCYAFDPLYIFQMICNSFHIFNLTTFKWHFLTTKPDSMLYAASWMPWERERKRES